VRSSERIRRNVGHLAFGLIGLVLLSMVWHAVRDHDWGAAVAIGVPSLALLWSALASRYEPGWEGQVPPPPSVLRTLVSIILWLGLGGMVALPELTWTKHVATGDPGPAWLTIVILALFASPAVALTHLEFLSDASVHEKAKTRWGIERLGPAGALTYLLAGRP
jgi:hypothetical protein